MTTQVTVHFVGVVVVSNTVVQVGVREPSRRLLQGHDLPPPGLVVGTCLDVGIAVRDELDEDENIAGDEVSASRLDLIDEYWKTMMVLYIQSTMVAYDSSASYAYIGIGGLGTYGCEAARQRGGQ